MARIIGEHLANFIIITAKLVSGLALYRRRSGLRLVSGLLTSGRLCIYNEKRRVCNDEKYVFVCIMKIYVCVYNENMCLSVHNENRRVCTYIMLAVY